MYNWFASIHVASYQQIFSLFKKDRRVSIYNYTCTSSCKVHACTRRLRITWRDVLLWITTAGLPLGAVNLNSLYVYVFPATKIVIKAARNLFVKLRPVAITLSPGSADLHEYRTKKHASKGNSFTSNISSTNCYHTIRTLHILLFCVGWESHHETYEN